MAGFLRYGRRINYETMEYLVIAIFAIVVLATTILTAAGHRTGWGVTPLGLLGLGFLVPFAMLLVGAL